jgi:hypothetical protein
MNWHLGTSTVSGKRWMRRLAKMLDFALTIAVGTGKMLISAMGFRVPFVFRQSQSRKPKSITISMRISTWGWTNNLFHAQE